MRGTGNYFGLSSIAIWHAYQRGDLGVPAPNAERAVVSRETTYVSTANVRGGTRLRPKRGPGQKFSGLSKPTTTFKRETVAP